MSIKSFNKTINNLFIYYNLFKINIAIINLSLYLIILDINIFSIIII